MASSAHDTTSQPKKVSQSPSDGPPKAALHKAQRQHVVGHSRMQRNTSFGKNLNKLKQLPQVHGGDPSSTKHHRRSNSGNSISAPSSPRPSFKRNASSGAIVRNANHSTTALRKNHSSGHLPRQGPSKNILKPSKSERTLAPTGKARRRSPSPETHPTVHFDLGEEEGPDDAWTEESASQSPTTTRSHTRSNSVVLEQPKTANTSNPESSQGSTAQLGADTSRIHNTSESHPHLERSVAGPRANGGSSQNHSRPPDADMITSRLLQRNAAHNLPPQVSSIEAMVVSDSHNARVLSQSQGSTLVDTPGRDLVSRFMDGDGSAGTPKDSEYLPPRNSPQKTENNFDREKRNKSAPNVAESGMSSRSRSQGRRSGTATPSDLPPSRTQQKLLLQRASSNIEPPKQVPAILPRGGAGFHVGGIPYPTTSEGRMDPRIQQQFNHINAEYKVVRRYRNPLGDAIARLDLSHRIPRSKARSKSSGPNGFVNVQSTASLSASFNESSLEGRRSRTSLESARGGSDDGDAEGRRSFESDVVSERNEAEEICRRLWESVEVAEGD